MEVVHLLGSQGFWQHQVLRGLVARAAENTVLLKVMATSTGQYAPVFLLGESPSLTEKPGRPQSTGSQKVVHDGSDPIRIDTRLFLPVAALPQ